MSGTPGHLFRTERGDLREGHTHNRGLWQVAYLAGQRLDRARLTLEVRFPPKAQSQRRGNPRSPQRAGGRGAGGVRWPEGDAEPASQLGEWLSQQYPRVYEASLGFQLFILEAFDSTLCGLARTGSCSINLGNPQGACTEPGQHCTPCARPQLSHCWERGPSADWSPARRQLWGLDMTTWLQVPEPPPGTTHGRGASSSTPNHLTCCFFAG